MDKNSLAAEDLAVASVETQETGEPKQTDWQRAQAQKRAEQALLAQAQRALAADRGQTPMDSLLEKLDEWLLQQPEWPVILYAPRNVRRQAAQLVARHLLTIPTRK